MSHTINPAQQSPRIENQVFKWYNGDQFSINWTIHLKDDEVPITYDADDVLLFSFFTADEKTLVHQFEFNNIQDDTVTLVFTEEISKKFAVGKYVYCVKFIDHEGHQVTIFAKNKVEVQECH